MALIIRPAILAKIAQEDHGCISEKEVRECFSNHCGRYCYDNRPQHLDRAGNPTPWFVAETNHRRMLKMMFVKDGADMELKSAYPATEKVVAIFRKFAS